MRSVRQTWTRVLTAAAVAIALVATSITTSITAQAAGALAVGKCGAYGFAYDYARSDRARVDALRKCQGKCKVVADIRRNCAALAIDGRNMCGPYGFASARQLGPAQNTALRQCYSHGGKDCMIRAFVCDVKG